MKKVIFFLIFMSLILPGATFAQKKASRTKKVIPIKSMSPREATARNQLSAALRMAQGGQYESAAMALFSLSRRPELSAERPQIKYILGNMLVELKMYQTAAFQYVDVIRLKNPKYMKQAIEKLSVVADSLGDDTILNYAVSRVDLSNFPGNLRDMIHYRLGEIKLRKQEFTKASEHFSKVSSGSSYFHQALYSKGLAELEANEPALAVATFNKMLDSRRKAPVTDPNRVAAQMGLARALYQRQSWDEAIEAYAQIPRDTRTWHQAVFEQTWAMLRAARFRSALSNFQTLHSAYYEDFYIPESLLLRGIVYLYICKYDEMEKVLSLFETTYGPVRARIGEFLNTNPEPQAFFVEIEKANLVKSTDQMAKLRLPYIALRYILDQGNVKRSLHYLEKLSQEKVVIESNSSFRASSLGQYALKILANRGRNTKVAVGDMVKAHLLNMRVELRDLYEQAGFIRYEMITGRKEAVKKKISGKEVEADQINERVDREFYVQNGYEYYPFQGEYWLDEVGNYHFLGRQSCE